MVRKLFTSALLLLFFLSVSPSAGAMGVVLSGLAEGPCVCHVQDGRCAEGDRCPVNCPHHGGGGHGHHHGGGDGHDGRHDSGAAEAAHHHGGSHAEDSGADTGMEMADHDGRQVPSLRCGCGEGAQDTLSMAAEPFVIFDSGYAAGFNLSGMPFYPRPAYSDHATQVPARPPSS